MVDITDGEYRLPSIELLDKPKANKKDTNVLGETRQNQEILERVLSDFGIAKLLEKEKSQETLTERNSGVGTPEYMSPEQCHGDKNIDGRSDEYDVSHRSCGRRRRIISIPELPCRPGSSRTAFFQQAVWRTRYGGFFIAPSPDF